MFGIVANQYFHRQQATAAILELSYEAGSPQHDTLAALILQCHAPAPTLFLKSVTLLAT